MGHTENINMISMLIPEGYRWYSMCIQRNSVASNFNKLFL